MNCVVPLCEVVIFPCSLHCTPILLTAVRKRNKLLCNACQGLNLVLTLEDTPHHRRQVSRHKHKTYVWVCLPQRDHLLHLDHQVRWHFEDLAWVRTPLLCWPFFGFAFARMFAIPTEELVLHRSCTRMMKPTHKIEILSARSMLRRGRNQPKTTHQTTKK